MAEKVKFPDFIKDGAKAAMEPLTKLEEKINESLKKITNEKNISKTEMKKVLNDALKWVKGTRTDFEKSFSDGVTKTLSILNLPTRDEIVKLEKKLKNLDKSLKSIAKTVKGEKKTGKKAKGKKPAVKKVAKKKPAVKKAAKNKPAVKKAAKKI